MRALHVRYSENPGGTFLYPLAGECAPQAGILSNNFLHIQTSRLSKLFGEYESSEFADRNFSPGHQALPEQHASAGLLLLRNQSVVHSQTLPVTS